MSSSLNICIESAAHPAIVSNPGNSTGDSTGSFVNRIFTTAVVFVGVISTYDAYLVFHFRETIDEQNPFCAWLITLEPEFVSVFMLGKCLGTIGVVSAMIVLFKYWRRVALPVAVSLVVFQIGLMSYLHCTDGRRQRTNHLAMATTQHSLSPRLETPNKATRGSRHRIRALKNRRRLARARHGLGQQYRLDRGQKPKLEKPSAKRQSDRNVPSIASMQIESRKACDLNS